jgi:ubiquitin-conjugating enzyme E2 variant
MGTCEMPRTSSIEARPTTPPFLGEPSRKQRLMWGVAVTGALMLLGALAIRLGRQVALLQWWVPFALLAGVALADFSSGVLHWAADTWGRADLPVIGPRLLVPFRVHHVNPDDFLRRRFLDTNGDVAALAIAPLVAMLWIPLDAAPGQVVALAGLGFCAFGVMTNQIHQWAHSPRPPRAVAVLQAAGLLLRPHAHARHHGRPYDGEYCITTGWWNRPLDAIEFFRRLEHIVTRVTGAVPRHDERHALTNHQTAHHDGAQDV